MDEVIESGRQLDETTLRDLHERCVLDLRPAARGMYRAAPAIIRASRTTPVVPAKIRSEMQNLFYQYNAYGNDVHPLEAIAWFHAAVESIRPFADGNGRTGCLWMNAQLRRSAYPPIAIKVDHGAEHKAGLEVWQVDGSAVLFCSLFGDAVEEELSCRIEFLSQGPVANEGPEGAILHEAEALGVIGIQPLITAKRLGSILGVSERQAQRIMGQLKDAGLIARNGGRRKGTWIVMEEGRSA